MWMPSLTLPSVDSDPYDLFCRVSSHRFWPRVSEQGVQLTADSFTFGSFPASTFWSTALRKRLRRTNSLFFPCVPWKTWVSNLTDLAWSCPVSPISSRVLELCWDHPGVGDMYKYLKTGQHLGLWGTSADASAKSWGLHLVFSMKEMTQPYMYIAYTE